MNKCKLCLNRVANQKNSHIIPDFIKKTVSNEKRQILLHNLKNDNNKIKQSLPTVDNLLCSVCENNLSKIERNCGYHLFEKYHSIDSARFFPLYRINYHEKNILFRKSLYLKPHILNLFILSIIWRAANSENFFKISLSNSFNENIRSQIANYLEKEIINNLDYFSYVIVAPELIKPESFNNISIGNGNEKTIILNLGHFSIMVFEDMIIDESELSFILYALQNFNSSQYVKIGTGAPEDWKNYNERLFLNR